MDQMKVYIVMLGASADLGEGTRWYKRAAESEDAAVKQLVGDLGRGGAGIGEAQVVEVANGPVTVTKGTRWEVRG